MAAQFLRAINQKPRPTKLLNLAVFSRLCLNEPIKYFDSDEERGTIYQTFIPIRTCKIIKKKPTSLRVQATKMCG